MAHFAFSLANQRLHGGVGAQRHGKAGSGQMECGNSSAGGKRHEHIVLSDVAMPATAAPNR